MTAIDYRMCSAVTASQIAHETSKCLKRKDSKSGSPAVEGLLYLAPACVFWLLIGIVIWELPQMQASDAWSIMASMPLLFGLAAVLGFAVNSLTYAVVILASSTTLKVLNAACRHCLHVCYVLGCSQHETIPLLRSYLAGGQHLQRRNCGRRWHNVSEGNCDALTGQALQDTLARFCLQAAGRQC